MICLVFVKMINQCLPYGRVMSLRRWYIEANRLLESSIMKKQAKPMLTKYLTFAQQQNHCKDYTIEYRDE